VTTNQIKTSLFKDVWCHICW